MPETTVHKNHYAVFRENDVGLSGQVFPVQAKPVAEAMKKASDTNLRFGVCAAYRSHVAAALFL
jgi:hypothetical protein